MWLCSCSHSCSDLVFFLHFWYCHAIAGHSKCLVSPFSSHSAWVFFLFFLSLVNNIIFSYILYHLYQSSILVLCYTLTQSSRQMTKVLVAINQYLHFFVWFFFALFVCRLYSFSNYKPKKQRDSEQYKCLYKIKIKSHMKLYAIPANMHSLTSIICQHFALICTELQQTALQQWTFHVRVHCTKYNYLILNNVQWQWASYILTHTHKHTDQVLQCIHTENAHRERKREKGKKKQRANEWVRNSHWILFG